MTINLLLEHLLVDILNDQFGQANFGNAKILMAPITEIDPNLCYHHHDHMHKLPPRIQLLDYLVDLALDPNLVHLPSDSVSAAVAAVCILICQFQTNDGDFKINIVDFEQNPNPASHQIGRSTILNIVRNSWDLPIYSLMVSGN